METVGAQLARAASESADNGVFVLPPSLNEVYVYYDAGVRVHRFTATVTMTGRILAAKISYRLNRPVSRLSIIGGADNGPNGGEDLEIPIGQGMFSPFLEFGGLACWINVEFE